MNIYIKEFGSNDTVKTINVDNQSSRMIEKTINGLMINMNLEKYYVDDSELKGVGLNGG
jgi:hypothetical protein